MITLRFPDGSQRHYEAGISGTDVAADLSKSLAKKAVAMRLDDDLRDLADEITADASIEIVTRDAPAALALIRHDCAHVLAEAVQRLYPGTQVTIGPVIADGFYYDFARNEPFTTDDFAAIEAEMRKIIAANEPFTREVWSREQAKTYFAERGEAYKVELIDAIAHDDDIRIYRQGRWLDLCRGPHMPRTGRIGSAFKLMKVAGAYWRGDSRNAMLSRIYGTAWASEKELKAYLHRLEEAEKRDHRRLGREMDLFHLQPEAQGSVFWHAKGHTIYRTVEAYMRRRLEGAGYGEVKTPQLLDAALWKQSGHWSKFRENMFVVPDAVPSTSDEGPVVTADADYMALKPMNCPAHVQIFKQHTRSYRDLPLRMAEFGCCHRNEAHGALHGIMRVRQMTQDDAHIFCREDQITGEARHFCALLYSIYRDFGFEEVEVHLSTRPETRAGDDAIWDKSEQGLSKALDTLDIAYELAAGEGAFYGPKLDFHLRDAIGRLWQCGTLQLDFVLPERLDAFYTGADGERHHPVMLHRAILGTLERFIGILLEDCAGRLPLWLAPVQVVVATITGAADAYGQHVLATLRSAGLRAQMDARNEKINYKVREHSHQKVPAIIAVGEREAAGETVSLRRLGSKANEVVALDEAVATLAEQARPPDLRRGAIDAG